MKINIVLLTIILQTYRAFKSQVHCEKATTTTKFPLLNAFSLLLSVNADIEFGELGILYTYKKKIKSDFSS
jgi:hypothetical protein